ncbi:MAG: carboxypeptidase-like regulatory domain-containing protein [Gemmatimonadetes bacterium]|nr:carboxypeptidase-like regulatory domain-containing protein [Gemmatimonadota bacterium]
MLHRAIQVIRYAMALLVVAGSAAGAQGPVTARLRGNLIDAATQAPIVGARVVIAATGRYVATDSSGRFDLTEIPSGVIRFFVTAEGYPRTSFVLAFARGEVMEQRFELEGVGAAGVSAGDSGTAAGGASAAERARAAQPLAPSVTTAPASRGVRYEDFERRVRTGRGQYVTRQVIEERGYNTLGDATRGMRGVNVECGGPRGCLIKMARTTPGCYPQYVVDGRPDNAFGPYIPVRDIEGLEVYTGASDVPGEFAGTDAACGVVVIWTTSGPVKKAAPTRP